MDLVLVNDRVVIICCIIDWTNYELEKRVGDDYEIEEPTEGMLFTVHEPEVAYNLINRLNVDDPPVVRYAWNNSY